MKIFMIAIFTLTSCSMPEYSPWVNDRSEDLLTEAHLKRLQDSPFEPFTIGLAADSQAVIGEFDDVRKKLDNKDIDFTLVMGDLTDRGLQQEFDWFRDVINRFNKPVLTVVGNHDGLSHGEDIYRRMFGSLNYSFIYKDIKFVAWNNNPFEFGPPDLDWLREEIESHSRVVVFAHQPPHAKSMTDVDEEIWAEIRQSPNLIASIHGHQHKFNHYQEDDGTPIYTTARVEDTKFGLMRIEEDKVIFFECTPECKEVK